jgi:glycogen debranching enzyme
MVRTSELREQKIKLVDIFKATLLENITSDGILASSRQEKYGVVFGRDTAISVLGTLKNLEDSPELIDRDKVFAGLKIGLLKLVDLQGKETNIESGEQPGKFIHEYRENNYERLVKRERPWFVYPDKKLRNYDSIDSTPLTLIAIHKFWQATGDNEFLLKVLPSVERGLNWIITYGDSDSDGLIEYELPAARISGGLPVQSWTDSQESLMDATGKFPKYPIAPVEVQGITWLALKIWADFYKEGNLNFENSGDFGQKLDDKASEMKRVFNKKFLFKDKGLMFAAQALDGDKNQIRTITGNPLLLLWATHKGEAIIEKEYVEDLVRRSFMPDLFDSKAGIRTMSTESKTYNPHSDSYHNGSVWPFHNGLIYEGLLLWGFNKEAKTLGLAMVEPLRHFNSSIELLINNGNGYEVYRSPRGDTSCMQQTWTAACVNWKLLT